MRSLAVVVLAVDADLFEVATAEDQQVVETLRSDGADEALGVGVRLRRADRCVDDADGPSPPNMSSKAAVNLLSRSWIRKRIRS